MSVATTALRQGLPFSFDRGYEPVSDGGRTIQKLWSRERNIQRGSANDWFPIINAALLEISRECRSMGWDGEGSVPVSMDTVRCVALMTECLASMVPSGTPAPDVVPEHDGDISLSWRAERDKIFAVSIGSHGKLNFAGQFGEEGSVHGWQPVQYDSRISLAASLDDVARNVGRLAGEAVIRRAA